MKKTAMCLGTIIRSLCFSSLLLAAVGCTSREVTVTIKSVEGAKGGAEKAGGTEEAPKGYGNFNGRVLLTGSAPPLAPLVAKGSAVKDPAVCAAEAIPDEALVLGNGNAIANVVIYLDRPKFIKEDLKAVPSTPSVFDQRGCRFMPHMLLVRVGQTVRVLSDDPIAHNTHTFPERNTSFNSAIPANERKGVDFKYTNPENNPLVVRCDLHPWMKAYHFPVNHPYAAVTDADGKFEIKGLPAGKHQFRVWQEKAQFLDRKLEVTIEADKDVTRELKYADAQFK